MYRRIEELCASKGINITQMCKEAGVARAPLTELKKGRTAILSAKNADKIATYFGVSVGYLLGRESADGAITRAILATAEKEKPADQKADGLRGTGYELLTPENKRMIDSLIAKLLESQSGE